mmetsp:Transcript_2765/g.8266  ORF Transcript_2765/g.8266 Transcript_2765/m.8266 type:complete len:272 (-) Transcript_2765:187-1002(-)
MPVGGEEGIVPVVANRQHAVASPRNPSAQHPLETVGRHATPPCLVAARHDLQQLRDGCLECGIAEEKVRARPIEGPRVHGPLHGVLWQWLVQHQLPNISHRCDLVFWEVSAVLADRPEDQALGAKHPQVLPALEMAHDLVHLLRRAAKVVQRTTAPVLIRFRVHLEDEVVVAVRAPPLGQSWRGLQLLQELAKVGAQVLHTLEVDLAEAGVPLYPLLELWQGLERTDEQVHVPQRRRGSNELRTVRHFAPEAGVGHLHVDGRRPIVRRTLS